MKPSTAHLFGAKPAISSLFGKPRPRKAPKPVRRKSSGRRSTGSRKKVPVPVPVYYAADEVEDEEEEDIPPP